MNMVLALKMDGNVPITYSCVNKIHVYFFVSVERYVCLTFDHTYKYKQAVIVHVY